MQKYFFAIITLVVSFGLEAGELKGYRADILYFTDNPRVNPSATKYIEDGVLLVQDGKVVDVKAFKEISHTNKRPNIIIDYSGRLIVPGFIDTHVHYPQTEMIGAYGDQLLDWLNNYTFPTEKNFSDKVYADRVAQLFLDQLLINGTTTALVFSTVDPQSVDSFFTVAKARNLRMISGKVLMDRNAPDYLVDTPQSAYIDSKKLIEKWHQNGRPLWSTLPAPLCRKD